MKDFQIKGKFYIGLILLCTLLLGVDYKARADFKEVKVLSDSADNITNYPILQTTYFPQISAKGAIVIDADSKVILYSKNPDLRFSTASTTKIMTALTALDHFKLDEVLTVKDATTEGVILGLKSGQQMTFENLLYGLLLPSANDIAQTIAQNYSQDPNEFVKAMNRNALKYNLYNTHFQDPAGLEDEGDYTTPLDLARLASVAIQNEVFAKIVSTKEKVVADLNGNTYSVKNLNKLLGVDGVDGIKTGYTEGAGQVLVTSKIEKGHTLIIVVMGSEDRFLDTEKLLTMVSGNITYLPIHP